ncbi:uncharacterized protein LOC113342044 isoform X2 [Papaver somniferum]|uniref:uncharacterized protein LOC113342044 isoform X2 n=2 Tax=Papaver somniferum TaxID=3469 RepID=UPI000E700461|nr:uncharacterized protein LOC113342044 isoform X2 [Papaver somniferum]
MPSPVFSEWCKNKVILMSEKQTGKQMVYVTFEDEGGAQSKGIRIKLMVKSLSNWIKLEFLPSVSFDCKGCLLIRQPLYLGDARNFVSVGGGITEVRRFHSSFHTAEWFNLDQACRVVKACCKRRRTKYYALVSRLSRIVQVSGFSDLTSFSSVSG